MSDLGGIDLNYSEGKLEKRKKNYLKAARLFLVCHYYYNYGELPVYYSHLERYGLNAMNQYEFCKSKLTDEAQRMLEKEEREFEGSWRDFVSFVYQRIKEEEGLPSPNRPVEKGRVRRWLDRLFGRNSK